MIGKTRLRNANVMAGDIYARLQALRWDTPKETPLADQILTPLQRNALPIALSNITRSTACEQPPASTALGKIMQEIRNERENCNVVCCTHSKESKDLDDDGANKVEHWIVFVLDILHLQSTRQKDVKPTGFANVKRILVGTVYEKADGTQGVIRTHADVPSAMFAGLTKHVMPLGVS